jgi:hypothetical protein
MRYSVKRMIEQGYILPTTDKMGKILIQKKFKAILHHTEVLNEVKLDKYQSKALGTVISLIYAMNTDKSLRKIDVKQFYDNLLRFILTVWGLEKGNDEANMKTLDRMINTFVAVMVAHE